MGDALALAKAFVVAKNVDFVLQNRPSRGPSELVANKIRLRGAGRVVNESGRVHRAIARELVGASMEHIGSGLRDRIDYAARSEAILRRIVVGQDRKLLNGVHAEVLAEYASRARIRVIVDDKTVQAIGVLRGAIPVDAQLQAQTPSVSAHLCYYFLGSNGND